MQVSPEKFVTTWQQSGSVQEVCDKLEMRRSAVWARAYNYRSKGIPLKFMAVHRPQLDVKALTALAKKTAATEPK